VPAKEDPTERRAATLHSFGRRLRALREQAGFSQEALADLAAVHRTYVSSVERGKRNISLANIQALADALGVPVEQMFRDAGPTDPMRRT